MSWAAVAGAAIGVVGGAMNSSDGSTQTVKNEIDPRIGQYLYGASGSGGLLNQVNNLTQQQYGQGGLNPMQTAGLEMQRQVLTDPQYTKGYGEMRSLGSGLLNQGVAGNPFTGGRMAMPQMQQPQMPPMQQAPNQQAGGAGGLVTQGPHSLSLGNINANTVTGPGMNAPIQTSNLGMSPVSAAFQPITQQNGAAPQASLTQDDIRAWMGQQRAQIDARIAEQNPPRNEFMEDLRGGGY